MCVQLASLVPVLFFHLYLCTNTHKYLYHDLTEKLKGLLQHCESSKGFISQYLFRILIAAQLHSRSLALLLDLLCMSCSEYDTVVTVSDHTHISTILYIFVLHCIQYVNMQPKFRSFLCHPFFFSKTIALLCHHPHTVNGFLAFVH